MKKKHPFALSFVLLIIAVLYLPVLLLVVFSFSGNVISFSGEFNFTFDLYKDLFANTRIMTAVSNTLLIAVISSFIATIIAAMAAMGVLSMSRRGKAVTMSLNQLPIINADIVTSFSIVLFFVTLNIVNAGFFKLILAHTLIALPFAVLTIIPRIRQLDDNLIDAALDLGATPFTAFLTVVVPQLLPAMFNAFLLGFTLSLDDFVITQYNNDGVPTISTEIYGAISRREIPQEFRALTAIIFAVILVSLIVFNLTAGKTGKKEAENV
jgi:spermidine/putrescine transport system permease protein